MSIENIEIKFEAMLHKVNTQGQSDKITLSDDMDSSDVKALKLLENEHVLVTIQKIMP